MRKTDALNLREAAAKIAHDRQHPIHVANGEERAYRDAKSFMSFTKGLPHDQATGLVKDEFDPVRLRTAIDSGYSRDFDLSVPLGCRVDVKDKDGNVTGSMLDWHFHNGDDQKSGRVDLDGIDESKQYRRWEAPTAGYVYDLEGPDCQAVTMPPAPTIVVQGRSKHADHCTGSSEHGVIANPELVAEMAEVYWLALLRDKHLSIFDKIPPVSGVSKDDEDAVDDAVAYLDGLDFYHTAIGKHPRRRKIDHGSLKRQDVFRGHTPGERKGPYLSQFMLMGSEHLGKPHMTENVYLRYGAITIDMRVRNATAERDYMTHWNEWLDVQNGANVSESETYVGPPKKRGEPDERFRFISTPRDLATYVHYDALYEAYLNACIWLLNAKAPFDPSFRHLLGNTHHTAGFALYGGPHILTLMTEVATRGLKAVRYQKFNNHLRLRPEALAGLIAAGDHGVAELPKEVDKSAGLLSGALGDLLDRIKAHNEKQNNRHAAYLGPRDDARKIDERWDLPLLPMAFPEGSPMHPSYGAGHATVAGACVTILKAFFDEDACLILRGGNVKAVSAGEVDKANDEPVAFIADKDGKKLVNQGPCYTDFLRVGDELNKLAANISIARNMAGVHYYSDYIDSLRMGEEIALGILQEQSIMYPKDPFNVSLTSFDGKRVIVGNGEIQCLDAETDLQSDAAEELIAAIKKNPEARRRLVDELNINSSYSKVA